MEVWKDINGFPKYQISNNGRVRSLKRKKPKILSPTNCNGYPYANFSNNGKAYCKAIHRLVAVAFVDNPDDKDQVNHIDANPLNNHYTNLEWVTAKENIKHASNLGLKSTRKDKPIIKLSDDAVIEIVKLWNEGNVTKRTLAARFNVSRVHIRNILNGKRRNNLTNIKK